MGAIRRRQFVFSAATVAFLGGCGVLPASFARPTSPVARVGILALDSTATINTAGLVGLRQGLAELGYVDGQNIVVELRDPGGSNSERLPELANELIRLPVDVLVALPSPAVLVAQRATTVVPIVFLGSVDPVGKGFVASLDHPGGNITGVANLPPTVFGKLIQFLAQLMPGLLRVAFISNFDSTSTSGRGGAEGPSIVQLTTDAATASGVQLKLLNVRRPGSSHLLTSKPPFEIPVTLPPGRARLCTSPFSSGFETEMPTMGTVDVACFAATVMAVPPVTSISTPNCKRSLHIEAA